MRAMHSTRADRAKANAPASFRRTSIYSLRGRLRMNLWRRCQVVAHFELPTGDLDEGLRVRHTRDPPDDVGYHFVELLYRSPPEREERVEPPCHFGELPRRRKPHQLPDGLLPLFRVEVQPHHHPRREPELRLVDLKGVALDDAPPNEPLDPAV